MDDIARLRHELAEAKQRAERAEQQTRRTTLDEYIEACHEFVFTKFKVEMDKSLTSKGSMTDPHDKWCPAQLLPWSGFLHHQTSIFETLYATFPLQTEAFESRSFLRDLGERVSMKNMANEKDLEYFQHISVEHPVHLIIKYLGTEKKGGDVFNIGDGIVFENHTNALSDVAEEVSQRRSQLKTPHKTTADRTTPDRTLPNLNQLRPDQFCVYKGSRTSQERSMAYIVEYKAPHKLTLPHLRLGLREMDIYKEVVNRTTRPIAEAEELRFQYDADRITAAAITQTFHYMIEGGLEYSLLTTGEAIVFLKVDWANPTVLYYHLAEPGPEVQAHPDNFRYCTAVAQVLAFTLMALSTTSQIHGQEERRSAMQRLQKWTEDYETILRSIPATERQAPPSSAGYVPRTYEDINRSPYALRRKKREADTDRPSQNITRRDQTPSGSDDEEPSTPESPSIARSRRCGYNSQQSQQDLAQQTVVGNSQGSSHRQYCTQKCLLGLVKSDFLDKQCPNVALHRGQTNSHYHRINHTEWLRLLNKQFSRTLDDGLVPLGKQGARGALFQVTLLEYGYTFVSKGTVSEFVPDLKHEATVYQQLLPLQGICVPVFLGAIDLHDISRTYFYDFRVRIKYMMFLSWAGQSLDDAGEPDTRKIQQELVRSIHGLHSHGVAHTDVREPNALWNQEASRVMIIDFERAVLLNPPRRPLAQVVPNKRRQTTQSMHVGKDATKVHSKADNLEMLDISAANFLCRP